jgi:hypothetical protein
LTVGYGRAFSIKSRVEIMAGMGKWSSVCSSWTALEWKNGGKSRSGMSKEAGPHQGDHIHRPWSIVNLSGMLKLLI